MTRSQAALVPPGPAANWRKVADAAPALADPGVIAEWWKNRRGEAIRLTLNRFESRDVIDLRTWYTDTADGKLKPGKGFAAEVRHLPRLAAAIAKAEAKARELGLIGDKGAADE